MYGQIKFQDFEIRKETQFSKFQYYYKNKKIDEQELKKNININEIENAKELFRNEEIEKSQFEEEKIIEIQIPKNVKTIGRMAFYGCEKMSRVIIPQSVTNIKEYAFAACTNLVNIIVDENNPVYDSRNDCNAIIETKTNKLLEGCQNTKIPEDIINIGENAFFSCKNLTNIDISEGVKEICNGAFFNCINLSNNTKIEERAFEETTKIIIKDDKTKDLDTIIKDYTVKKGNINIKEEIEK